MKKAVLLSFCSRIISVTLLIGIVLFFLQTDTNSNSDNVRFTRKKGIPGSLKAMDMWSDMRTYPSRTMDASDFSTSFLQASYMGLSQSMSLQGVFSPTTAPWVDLGPKNFAGRILSIAFHPTDPDTMWVGSASGGLWKTTTGGSGGPGGISWQFVPTGFPVLGISSIVVNPFDAREIYIGTGEVYSSNPAGTGSTGAGHVRTFRGSYGIGILKTTDGGATWTKTLDFADYNLKGVMDMLVHPTCPDTVFAATTDGLYRTKDAGANWTLIQSSALAMDMCFKPGDPNVLYLSSGNFQSAGRGLYRITNASAASPTITAINSGLPATISGKIMLAVSAENPSKIYASVGKDPNTTHTQGLYVSTTEGGSWAAAGTANMLGSQGWYGHDVAVSPADENRLIWAELDTYLSTDGGATKTQEGIWSQWDIANQTIGDLTEGQLNTTSYVHADVHRIVASPHDATGMTFFLCTDGGLFRTTDGGDNYNTLNGGLNTAQIYSNISVHPTNPNYMLIGLQDNEAMVYEGSPGCRRIGNLGDGFHTAINYNGTIQLVESYYFNRRRSTNSGGTWGAGSGAVPTSEVACFNVPMVFSKAASSTYMFAGTVKFKRSLNSGSTWTNLNGDVAIAGANNPVIAMAAPTNSIVYFSTAPASGIRSKMWKTTNATNSDATVTFSDITNGLPDRYYSKISVDPTNPQRLAVTLSGFNSSHVFLSVDGGANWIDIGSGLPNVPHNTVIFDPNNPATIYVGNDIGVFYANNVPTGTVPSPHTLTWTAYNEGFTDAIMVSDLAITSTNLLRLASYGRGLWQRELAPSSNMPVVFKQFDVVAGSTGNKLKWIISSQSNVDRYDVEYSTDGLNFYKVGSVPAVNSPGDITYTFLHSIQNDVNGFYRIKNVDMDQSYTYSSVEMVKAVKFVSKLTAYPNPTTGIFKIRVPVNTRENMKLIVYDQTGRLVMLKNVEVQIGKEITVDISKVNSGTYQVVCEGSKTRWLTSIIKK